MSVAWGLLGAFALPAWSDESAAEPAQSLTSAEPHVGSNEEQAGEKKIDIWEFDVEGNTVLDDDDIYYAVQPFLGPQSTLDDVDKARDALERLYRRRGYKTVSVAIPRQTVQDGVVRLEVVASQVEHLDVVNSRFHSPDRIKAGIPSMAQGSVPDFNQVQKEIVALNQTPDMTVTPALRAGSKPGTIDVDLAVEDHLPLHGSVEVNNAKSPNTSELRTQATLSYDNLWQRGHSLSMSYQTAPQNPSNVRVFYGSYLARFGASPFSIVLNGIQSHSNVATIGGTNVVGQGETVVLRGFFNVPGGAKFFSSVYFGVDYKHVLNVTEVSSDSSASGPARFETPITYFPFALGYNISLWQQDKAYTSLDVSVNFAFSQLGSNSAEFDDSRYRARGQQLYLKENLSRTMELPLGLQGVIRLAGQISDQPLLSTEQFSAGGAESVRGYLEAETLGDFGFSGSLELRSPQFEDLFAVGEKFAPFDRLVCFGFVDGAKLLLRNPLPEQHGEFRLMSAGVGLNFKMFSTLSGAVDWAKPFFSTSTTRAWSSRVLFKLTGSF